MKTYLHKPIKVLQLGKYTWENSKALNTTSKYFSIFNKKPPASWVAHVTRNFLTSYSYSYYSSWLNWLVCDVFLHLFSNLFSLFLFLNCRYPFSLTYKTMKKTSASGEIIEKKNKNSNSIAKTESGKGSLIYDARKKV